MNETRMAERLCIGAFAREARPSLKALRLYDALGLLAPVFTDPQSGYHYYEAAQLYYEAAQLPRAKLIGLLRQLDMPLTRIAEVLELSGQAAADAVGAYWREVERDAAVKRQLVHYLETFLSGKGDFMCEVQTREAPEQKVATVQRGVYEGLAELHRRGGRRELRDLPRQGGRGQRRPGGGVRSF